jgi:transposase InsO family protein
MDIQKQGVIDQVKVSLESGRKLKDVLTVLGIKQSTYYRWKNYLSKTASENPVLHPSDRKTSKSLTAEEVNLILKTKDENPQMRHRQIQGLLQKKEIYISESSVFNVLKTNNLVERYERRPAPWDEPFYEIYRANMMWGADWTKMRIGGERWYLLTMIDFFSRKIISWKILKTVVAKNITELYLDGIDDMQMPHDWHLKPELRVDQGSPNTAHVTKRFFKDIEAELSFARVHRPTDNARTERFYGTIKQEEIYLVGDYQDEITANEEIKKYIEFYNDERPHQSLWNFTPSQIHEMNNKTENLNALKDLKIKSWTNRKEYWIKVRQQNTSH